MSKNTKIYNNSGEFRKQEGISLASSKEMFEKILTYLEGMVIDRIEIHDGYLYKAGDKKGKLSGHHITIYIPVERDVKLEDFEGGSVKSNTEYTIRVSTGWKLYEKGELIYDDNEQEKYEDPKLYEKRLSGTTLKNIQMNKEWNSVKFIFDNSLELVKDAEVVNERIIHFFTVTKTPEPFMMYMDFGRPERIEYRNEIVQLEVMPRKDKQKVVI